MEVKFGAVPDDLLQVLATYEGGGVLYMVAGSPLLTYGIPCFVIRSPVDTQQIEETSLFITVSSTVYDGVPVVALHLNLHDLPPAVEGITLRRGIEGVKITQPGPFKLECFLNPTNEDDRAMLQALAESPLIHVEFFLDASSLPYQGAKDYVSFENVQRGVTELLRKTQGMSFSEERFALALTRFKEENPWLSSA